MKRLPLMGLLAGFQDRMGASTRIEPDLLPAGRDAKWKAMG